MKKFISISPFQSPETDSVKNGVKYAVNNNPDLEYGLTEFPIIPVINAYAEKGEQIEIVTVISDYENSKANYEKLKTEVEELSKIKGFEYNMKEIITAYNDELDTQLDMFGRLIDVTADDDILYADITYGSKVMTQVLNMALNYGYRIHNNVALGCIVYGKYNHLDNTGIIYDQTSLSYMDEIVRVLAESKIKNPAEKIKNLLK